jgi:hypothetical protein
MVREYILQYFNSFKLIGKARCGGSTSNSALRKLRQEDHKFEASLGDIMRLS